eukprot:g4860.t1
MPARATPAAATPAKPARCPPNVHRDNAAAYTTTNNNNDNNSSSSSTGKHGLLNVVLVLADDLDLTLGGFDHGLPTTRRLLGGDAGLTASNWFIHTPICCPSRAELLTGRYLHNLKVPHPNDPEPSCMQVKVSADTSTSDFYSKYYFAPHFAKRGYRVGIFGKHLNNQNPTCPPPGVDRWMANNGGAYLNPTFSYASPGVVPSTAKFNNCSKTKCYSTSVIGNASQAWINEVFAEGASAPPFFAYVAVKAPHIQDGPGWPMAIPAPWYSLNSSSAGSRFAGAKAPRTPNWNASCPDHHWLIRTQPPMTAEQARRSDELYASRLASLLSVDDMIEDIVATVEAAGKMDQTIFAFTSDHGYRFGQFRMPQGKWNAYDNDLRIPLLLRGPGITPGSTYAGLGSNVDLIPTLMDLAGLGSEGPPSTMDGRSLAAGIRAAGTAGGGGASDDNNGGAARTRLLFEYIGGGDVVRYEHLEDTGNNTFRGLRVIDPAAPSGQRNLKFVEFTDKKTNWNWTSPASEAELFDLDKDPYEMHNLYSSADPKIKASLHQQLAQLYTCRGSESCG